LDITDEIKASFKSLLEKQKVDLEFSYGHWAGLAQDVENFDLVLTAETIYAEESVDDLLSVLKASTRSEGGLVEKGMDKMSIQDKGNWTKDIRSETVILVAAKVSSPIRQSLTSGLVLWGRRRTISIPTSSRTEWRVVYDDQRVDTGSRKEGSTDRVRLREGMRQNVGGVEGGVESTMSLSFSPYQSINSLWLTRRDRSHLSSSSHLLYLSELGKNKRIDLSSESMLWYKLIIDGRTHRYL